MDHTEERHYENINSLCRVCGNLTYTYKNKKAYKKPYLVEKISDQLRIICGTTLLSGDAVSKYLCHNCHDSIRNCLRRNSHTTQLKIKQMVDSTNELWISYDPGMDVESCSTCKRRDELRNYVHYQSKRHDNTMKAQSNHVDTCTDQIQTHSLLDTQQNNSENNESTLQYSQQNTSHANTCLQENSQTLDSIDQRSIVTVTDAGTETPHTPLPLTPPVTCPSARAHSLTASPARSDTDDFLSAAYDEWQTDIDNAAGKQVTNTASTPIKTNTSHLDLGLTPVKVSPLTKCAFTSPKDKHYESLQNLLDKSISEPLDKRENILTTKLTKRKSGENIRKKLDPDVLKFQTVVNRLLLFEQLYRKKIQCHLVSDGSAAESKC